jgi:multiple sugar transport system substrate-binding protein
VKRHRLLVWLASLAMAGGLLSFAAGQSLTLVGWAYAPDYAKALLQQFTQEYGIQATFDGLPSGATYSQLLATKFLSREPIDVLYLEDFSLTPFIASGWLKPLKDFAPPGAIAALEQQMTPSFVSAWTVNGELYALPYYQTVWLPVYNKDMFAKAGITAFPDTWAGLKEAALKIKQAGILDYPITLPIANTWTDKYQLFSMVYSQGGRMFDDQLNPLFDQPNSAFRTALNWLLDGIYTSKFINPKSLETNEADNWRAFADGQAAISMIPGYRAAQIFDPSVSKVTDAAALALTPGTTHDTVAWSRGYVVGAYENAQDSQIWDLIDFLGGKGKDGTYPGRRGWMQNYFLDSGYGFIWNDPGVHQALTQRFGDNVEVIRKQTAASRSLPQAPWMASWVLNSEQEINRALTREISVDQAVKNLASSWATDRQRFPGY